MSRVLSGDKDNPHRQYPPGFPLSDEELETAIANAPHKKLSGMSTRASVRSPNKGKGTRKIRVQAELKCAESSESKINLGDMHRDLNKSIQRLRTLQATYTPGALVQLARLDIPQDVLAENVPLVLPSDLAQPHRASCAQILDIERELREAQCRVTLAELCNQLHIKARLLLYKKNHSRHQAQNTRSRAVINTNESKIKQRSDKYQACRRALCNLLGAEPAAFPELRKRDIRCMNDTPSTAAEATGLDRVKETRRARREAELVRDGDLPLYKLGDGDDEGEDGKGSEDEDVRGESRRVMSWIWNSVGETGSDTDMEEALRSEFCKAYARVRRWREEVLILQEEWRRLPISFKYEADRWRNRLADLPATTDASLTEGRVAYASKQEALFLALIERAEETRTAPKIKRGYSRRKAGATRFDADAHDEEDARRTTTSEVISTRTMKKTRICNLHGLVFSAPALPNPMTFPTDCCFRAHPWL
ncbi:hypothetical protein MKEN_00331000 [Mycena kentingensis (nom. inval.)]|nr:hypothetical protein MKEN_00331000 [Mycena kentingensis (nom. inval.)]